jgi:hypothetical protein
MKDSARAPHGLRQTNKLAKMVQEIAVYMTIKEPAHRKLSQRTQPLAELTCSKHWYVFCKWSAEFGQYPC